MAADSSTCTEASLMELMEKLLDKKLKPVETKLDQLQQKHELLCIQSEL